MFAVKNDTETLLVTDDFELAEAYAFDRYNRIGGFVEVVDMESNRVEMSIGECVLGN